MEWLEDTPSPTSPQRIDILREELVHVIKSSAPKINMFGPPLAGAPYLPGTPFES
jgi:hypothetical protein